MRVDVASYVGQLLYDRDMVALKDFGAFVASYKPSVIDHVQGLLHPPSIQLQFDPLKKEEDIFFINFICGQTGMTENEVKELVAAFVKQTLEALDRREIIVFPNVGRLYMDYESTYQFLQDSTNFNTDSFGLSTVQFYPILRTLNEANIHAPIPRNKRVELPKSRPAFEIGRRLREFRPAAMVSLVLLTLAFSIYYFTATPEQNSFGIKRVPVVEGRVNQKPYVENEAGIFSGSKKQEDKGTVVEDELADDLTKIEEIIDEDGEFETAIDTEAITSAPDQKEAVIIIGAFSKKAGVRKRVEQIYELGFDAYQDKKKNLTRVGVQFLYEDDKELEKNLRFLRKKFDKNAFLLE